LGSSIVAQYSVGPTAILHGRIIAREYVGRLGNQVQQVIHMLFPNNDEVFQDDGAPIYTAVTVQSWFEKHEGEYKHLSWPAQSPDLENIEQFWSPLETEVRNRFPSQISLKPLEDVLQEE
jgi:hypothetical protein